jgi:hypothetical protein
LSKGGFLGGGPGCITWVGLGVLTWAIGMSLLLVFGIKEESLDGITGVILFILLALSTLILSWKINQHLEKKWAGEKAETDGKENAERERQRELERKYYRENPQRLVTDVCPACNMEIPALGQICPYCRTNLREER